MHQILIAKIGIATKCIIACFVQRYENYKIVKERLDNSFFRLPLPQNWNIFVSLLHHKKEFKVKLNFDTSKQLQQKISSDAKTNINRCFLVIDSCFRVIILQKQAPKLYSIQKDYNNIKALCLKQQ